MACRIAIPRKNSLRKILLQQWIPSTSSGMNRKIAADSAANGNIKIQGKPISEMPGLRSLPFFGCSLSLMTRKDFDIKKFHLMWFNLIEELGPIIQLKLPLFPPMVLITNPDDIEKLFRVTMENPVREGFFSLKKVRQDAANNYFEKGGGLLVENNEEWWRVRSKVQTPMMRPKNVVKYLPQMDEVALCFMDRIAELQSKNGEMPGNFLDELYKWALESVGLVALNRRLGCLDQIISPDSEVEEMIRNVNVVFESMNETELGLPFWKIFPTRAYKRLKEAHDSFLRIADAHICQTEAELLSKLKNHEGELEVNLMETLLNTEGLTRKDVVTMILDMLFAGIDSTSHVVAFTLYCLSRNPKAQKRLQEEVDSVLGDGQGTLTEGQLARLSFTKACVKESMRMFPIVAGQARMLQEDIEFGGYVVPKGYQVITHAPSMGKDESLFPKANEFLPERWGRDRPLGPIHPFASIPFSYGPRMCIGRRIAEQEIFTFLARAMHRFNVEYHYNDMEMITKLIFSPSEPLRFQFHTRR